MRPKNSLLWKAFKVLGSFHCADEELTSLELGERAQLPKASAHRIITTLEEIGAISRGPNGRFRLGMMIVSLSHNVAIGGLLRDISHAIMRDLATRLKTTVQLGVLQRDMVTYVAKVTFPNSFVVPTRVGSQLEAYCTGLGKVLLAALPEEDLENFVMSGELVALTPNTITSHAQLRAELERVRFEGYALDNCECAENMFCAAAPIRDAGGRTIAAISITDEISRITTENRQPIIEAVMAAARAISEKIDPHHETGWIEPRRSPAILKRAAR